MRKSKFKIGDPVVHLSHGVGTVVGIETREFSPGKTNTFYILEIVDNGAPKKVFVPVDAAGNRLRSIMSKADARKVIAILNGNGGPLEPIDHQTWSRRYMEYMERIHTGDPFKVASVVVALRSLQRDKDLSFGERKLLDQALRLIQAELTQVEGLDVVFI